MVESKTYDDAMLSGTHFKWTLIASLGDFLDAGMLAGTGITLLAISSLLHFTTFESGLPALISLLGCAFGALTFGRLGDKFGRKFIYQIDMILYAVASILLAITGIFSSRIVNIVWSMIFYALIGIAVGADVPTSWSLITEFSPKNYRGRLMSITTIMWYVGVLVELGIAIALYNTGMILFRVIWIFLGIIAIISWALRRSLTESPRFDMMKGNKSDLERSAKLLNINISEEENKKFTIKKYAELFTRYGWFLLFAWFLYLMWGIPASTYGEFFPYIFSSLHLVSLRTTYAFEAIYFGSAIVPGLLIFYYLSDRIGRTPLYLISAAMAAISFLLLVYPPFLKNVYVLLSSFLLFGIGQGLGVWPTTRLLSMEHFPTSLRNSGQGFVWFTMRFEAGIFGLFTPIIVAIGVEYIGLISGIFFILAFTVVFLLYIIKPEYVKTERKSLEETSYDEVI
ncbi:MFS transporter [Picrophilus oshimae]|uniref:MFS transporter, SP family, inositol transporter n=1 Tax=Picrophilus torridus (strain ATCC 700027 / DSM 9790 / JCM 10055 / NBRC 100828 / KAW 2/3) TaxID=1122961 RepID=A0A8G2L7U2_PICTO|nr:MFS transporter [Picrophilus oshimae]SMD31467.1 MFS transporter, SP family, inositol transporter [Picrophilus oshimae DSM 9789]